ncbi:unnamed protein product [Dovyalis caffra]|uniref:FLZ-type domain-containing protein n=1 Tax=Dovyalis caffra TaxID=77055 RepID=A0AAV1SMI7_9ROSI|nr:unnamed protein product [Dovyalis caffra]
MLGKRTNLMIGRLSELLVSGNRARLMDANTSPRSPLDYKIQSPRGLKNYYDLGGVGLGIVAALDKSSEGGMKFCLINSGKTCKRFNCGFEEMEMESLEDYTYVTIHGPNQSFTKVYYDGGEYGKRGHQKYDRRCENMGFISVTKELPAKVVKDVSVYPTSDFLSSCHLCRKKLHGKDIYMYRGEKAFCSVECRSSQIMIDERKEQCRPEVARSADMVNRQKSVSIPVQCHWLATDSEIDVPSSAPLQLFETLESDNAKLSSSMLIHRKTTPKVDPSSTRRKPEPKEMSFVRRIHLGYNTSLSTQEMHQQRYIINRKPT